MITSLELLTFCFPDNFQGSPEIVLAVPCWQGMAFGDLVSGLEETSNNSDYGMNPKRLGLKAKTLRKMTY